MAESGAERLAKLLAARGRTPSPAKSERARKVAVSYESGRFVAPLATSALHVGDCRQVMAGLPPASVDAIITDPGVGTSSTLDGWEKQVPGPTFWEALLRVAKPGAWMAVFSGRKTDHRVKAFAEDAGWEIRDTIMWVFADGKTNSLDVGQAVDKKLGGPGVPYFRTIGAMTDEQRHAFMGDLDNPWFGYGTELRPSWEPIALFRKPTNLSYGDNAIEHGTGALNVDAARVPSGTRDAVETYIPPGQAGAHGTSLTKLRRVVGSTTLGRWPADVLLSHGDGCGDDAGGEVPDRSGEPGAGGGSVSCVDSCPVGLMGDAAKFFYCARPSRAEKDVGLPSKGNAAKSVKPAAVVEWVANLIVPEGATVLDPFMGTGSTGMGVMAVKGSKFVGIDDDPYMVELAEKRLAAWAQRRRS